MNEAPAAPGRQARRRAATRSRLLAAAQQLIAERGFDAVTLADVTKAADLGTGTIYTYFPTIADLKDAVGHEALDTFGDQLDRMASALDDSAEVYSFSLRQLVRAARTDPVWGRLMVQMGVAHPLLMEVLGPRARRDLERGREQGRFHFMDLDIAVACTFGSLQAVLHLVVSDPDNESAGRRYAVAMLRMVGMSDEEAEAIAQRPLPVLPEPQAHRTE